MTNKEKRPSRMVHAKFPNKSLPKGPKLDLLTKVNSFY